jgi:hypothetical protein
LHFFSLFFSIFLAPWCLLLAHHLFPLPPSSWPTHSSLACLLVHHLPSYSPNFLLAYIVICYSSHTYVLAHHLSPICVTYLMSLAYCLLTCMSHVKVHVEPIAPCLLPPFAWYCSLICLCMLWSEEQGG